MLHRTLGFLAVVALLLVLPAASAAEVKGKMITFKSGEEEIKGFLAEPEGKGPFPAIVVIQEWWGLTDWIKDNAKKLAEHGYVCLAPDLYRGKVATEPAVAGQLMKGMPQDRALRDLKGALDALAANEKVDKQRIGSIGWCMGGGLSLQLALHDKRIKACAMCYGRVVTDADKLKSLNGPVLGVFGAEDRGIPPAAVRKFEAALKEAGKKVERIHIYPNAGHGFMRGGGNRAYNAEAAKEAWGEIDKFFAKALKK
jgi:carboxymethylenebutenolidase